MKDYPLCFGEDRSLVGILTEKGPVIASGEDELTSVILLNAGLVHHIGPNRIYVKLARRLANMGCVVLRFDLSGIGDSGPRRDKLPAAKSVIDETQQAMDYLERHKGTKHFVLIGLCSGAADAFQVALVDQRVEKAILINPLLPETPQVESMRQSSYYRRHAFLNPRSWLKFIFLQSSYRDIWQAVRLAIRKRLRPNFVQNNELAEVTMVLKKSFRSIQTRGVELLIIYAEGEIGDQYFRETVGEEYRSLQTSGLLSTESLTGADHMVTPLVCQEKLLDLVAKWMAEKCNLTWPYAALWIAYLSLEFCVIDAVCG